MLKSNVQYFIQGPQTHALYYNTPFQLFLIFISSSVLYKTTIYLLH